MGGHHLTHGVHGMEVSEADSKLDSGFIGSFQRSCTVGDHQTMLFLVVVQLQHDIMRSGIEAVRTPSQPGRETRYAILAVPMLVA